MMFQLIQLYSFCPQLVALCSSGKAYELDCHFSGLIIKGIITTTVQKAYCLLRSSISTIPFFLDDPKIALEIAELICYFNGTISANVVIGDTQPLTCPLFATNFSIGKDKRYDCHTQCNYNYALWLLLVHHTCV